MNRKRSPGIFRWADNMKSMKILTVMRMLTVLLILTAMLMLITGCAPDLVVGDINDAAPVALITFEAQEDGIEGVVYREVNRLPAFLAASERPVLVVFYTRQDMNNTLLIPQLEQMADDYRDQLQIVWIDADVETDIAASFNVARLPQFTVVRKAVLERSLVGYDESGAAKLVELLAPYLNP